MDDAELRQQLRAILDVERADSVDWPLVQQLSVELSERLSEAKDFDVPHLVYHYLHDADIRERDIEYADDQRAGIQLYVATGAREHLESRGVSPWSCLIVVGVLVAAVVWLLN